jgi:hypothetical protein
VQVAAANIGPMGGLESLGLGSWLDNINIRAPRGADGYKYGDYLSAQYGDNPLCSVSAVVDTRTMHAAIRKRWVIFALYFPLSVYLYLSIFLSTPLKRTFSIFRILIRFSLLFLSLRDLVFQMFTTIYRLFYRELILVFKSPQPLTCF